MKSYLFAIALAVLLMASATYAQAPRTLSYQGMITGAGNILLDGNHSITVKLYDAANGGFALHSESFRTTVSKGIFSVVLGSTTPISATLAFDKQYWVGISIDGGIELNPRASLTSVPYAIKAESISPDAAVTSINGATGDLTIQGAGGTTVTKNGNILMITSSGAGGTGMQGIQSSDGSLFIANPNGPTATVNIAPDGVTSSKIADNAISSSKIMDAAVTPSKIDGSAASTGFVLTKTAGGVDWSAPQGNGGGLTLPYSANATDANALFSINQAGTGAIASFKITESTNSHPALYAQSDGSGAAADFYKNVSSPNSTVSVRAGGNTTTSALFARTDGSGSGAIIRNYNASNSAHALVVSTAGTGESGNFQINNSGSTADALYSSTDGKGAAIRGTSTISSYSTATGILGEANSTLSGSGTVAGVSGILGTVVPTNPGGYSAGVRGINNGTGSSGIGVIGYQAGSGWGLYGESPSGYGVFGYTSSTSASTIGVLGQIASPNGAAVKAVYSGSGVGVALELYNGAIKVSGNNKPAFTHTATVANISTYVTTIDNPVCNGDPNAILLVSHVYGSGSNSVYDTHTLSVWYNNVTSKWTLYHDDLTSIPVNAQYFVLVIKQ